MEQNLIKLGKWEPSWRSEVKENIDKSENTVKTK